MHKLLPLIALFVLLSGSLVHAQETVNLTVTIDRTEDIIAILVGGNQSVSLESFNIVYFVNDVEQPAVYLRGFPAFQPINTVQPPACFVIRTFQTRSPLPENCANLQAEQIFIYSLTPGGVFWFDPTLNRQRSLTIRSDAQAVQVCQSELAVCQFTFPAAVPPSENSEPTPSPACAITDQMNLLSSPDTDNDGLSDFEEQCVLQTDFNTPNRDVDSDGVIDDLELVFAANNPAWANPSRADSDSDKDWLFDTIEREINLATDRTDTDGDLLSDFIEFYWLGTDPKQADRDSDFDGFPDVLEVYLPLALPDFTPCRVAVMAEINRIFVADREEDNDPQEIIVGDEAEVSYALRDRTGNAGVEQRTWEQERIQTGDEFTDIRPLGPIDVSCGSVIEFSISAIESDAPFGGIEELGEQNVIVDIIFQRIPIAHHLSIEQLVQFVGSSEDGFFDYQIFYQLDVQSLQD